jgi:Tol biopolymer transport system component
MTTRETGTPRLFTAPLQDGATAEVVDIRVAKADAPCVVTDQDAAPWVSRDGKTLLFSHTRMDNNCAVVAGQKRDLYTTLLQPATGQPPKDASNEVIPATPMNDVNSSADDVEPSFSADMCDLYFASNRDGNFAVYRAHRR